MKHIAALTSKVYGVGAVLVGGFFALSLPKSVMAVETIIPSGDLSTSDPRTAVDGFINVGLGFLGIIAVVLFLYGGFLWMTAGGNEENVAKAKKIITASVIGLAIILISAAAVNYLLTSLQDETGAQLGL